MGYKTQSSDTPELIDKMQFARLRKMGRKERFERGLRRVDESLMLMRRAFERSHSHLSPEQKRIEWIRVQHGEELARHVEEWQCKIKETKSDAP